VQKTRPEAYAALASIGDLDVHAIIALDGVERVCFFPELRVVSSAPIEVRPRSRVLAGLLT